MPDDDKIQHSAHGIGTLIQKFNNQFSTVTRQKKNEWLLNFNNMVNNYTGTAITLNNNLFKVTGDSVDTTPFEGVEATMSADLTVPSGNNYYLPFDSIEYDPGNNFDTATNTYTVPSDGYYRTDIGLYLNSFTDGEACPIAISYTTARTVDYDYVKFYRQLESHTFNGGTTVTRQTVSANDVMYLLAGDTIETKVENSTNFGLTVAAVEQRGTALRIQRVA